ncbi:uncharacterized protein [Anabrus simplex]|uniref:uncharacterized protein isoform X2 n=1 Tax=Anabrus simplex TaxID=316456 RepID=UPI0034DD723E
MGKIAAINMDDKGNIDMDQLKKNIHLINSDSLRTAVINDLKDMVKNSNVGADHCERAFLFITAGYNTLLENKEVQAMITTAKSMAGEFMKSYISEVLANNN